MCNPDGSAELSFEYIFADGRFNTVLTAMHAISACEVKPIGRGWLSSILGLGLNPSEKEKGIPEIVSERSNASTTERCG
jgi:hypothetical protein